MSEKIVVILAKANWCSHCQRFGPVFDYVNDIYKSHDDFKNLDIKFESYDLADEAEKTNFVLSHYNAMEKVDGYPTVMVKTIKNNKLNYTIINHVEAQNINDKNDISNAANIFIENILNCLKSINSENKSLYVQVGGKIPISYDKTSLKEEIYRKKYLKYKSKYLNLKK